MTVNVRQLRIILGFWVVILCIGVAGAIAPVQVHPAVHIVPIPVAIVPITVESSPTGGISTALTTEIVHAPNDPRCFTVDLPVVGPTYLCTPYGPVISLAPDGCDGGPQFSTQEVVQVARFTHTLTRMVCGSSTYSSAGR